MMFSRLMLAAVAAAALTAETPAKLACVQAGAASWLKQFDVPSVAVAYIENGRLAWTSVHGEQSPGVQASEKTLYNVASLTKPISAEVLLRLAAQGKVDLDEPMSAHWVDPDVASHPWHKLLTPRLALTHQTGFKNWRYQTDGVLKFAWQPGTQYGYSGEGYDYAARFAEKKLHTPFEDLAQREVFDAIGMGQTSFTRRPWHAGGVAQPHGRQAKLPFEAPLKWTAADLLHTTIGDYAKFVVSVMANQQVNPALAKQRLEATRNVATPRDVASVCRKAKLTGCTATAGPGLGWEVLKLNGETIIRHGGADPGVRTAAVFVPAKGLGFVVFTNGEEGSQVIQKVAGCLYPAPMLIPIL